jgi:hypothetical protein
MFCVKRTEKYQRLSDISSTNARKALIRTARDQGVVPKEIGPDKEVRPEALEWLEAEGLVKCTVNRKHRTIWRSTDRGARLVRQHSPRFLRRSYSIDNYTTSPAMALSDAGEVIDWPQAA